MPGQLTLSEWLLRADSTDQIIRAGCKYRLSRDLHIAQRF